MKAVTLVFLRRQHAGQEQLLLAMKKRGFGDGLWNGAGGKVEPGETFSQAAVREVQEEIGVTPRNLRYAGYLHFVDPAFEHDCRIFDTETWDGEPAESEEMRPQWFNISDIPYDDMWQDDRHWLPHLVARQLFSGTVELKDQQLLHEDIHIVEKLPELA